MKAAPTIDRTIWLERPDFAIGQVSMREEGELVSSCETETSFCVGVSERFRELEVEGARPTIVGPDVIRIHRPGDQIRTRDLGRGPHRAAWIVFSAAFANRLNEGPVGAQIFGRAPPPVFAAAMPELARMRTMFAKARRGADGFWAEEAAVELLHALCGAGPTHQETRPPSARQAAISRSADCILQARYAAPLRLSGIAADLNVSLPYLTRSFRAVTGRTLHTRLTRLRIAEALRRLADGWSDITSLALDLGYSSHSHFSADFRRIVGVPPSTYRARSKFR